MANQKRKFQVGDLIITKNSRNHRKAAYITKIGGPDNYWSEQNITIQHGPDTWLTYSISWIEHKLCNPCKIARWYHYPVNV